MNNKFSQKPIALTIAVSLGVAGCSSSDEIASNSEIVDSQNRLNQLVQGQYQFNSERLKKAPFEYLDTFDVLGGAFETVEKQPLPPAFDETMNFSRQDDIDLQTLLQKINRRYQKYGIVVNISEDAREYLDSAFSTEEQASTDIASSDDSTGVIDIATLDTAALESKTITNGFSMKFNVHGLSLRHAMDLITANTNTWWRYENNRVTIYRTEPMTFLLDANGVTYTKNFNQSATTNAAENSSGSSFSSQDQTKNALEQIKTQVELMLTTSGRVFVNEHDSSITVNDTPPRLKKVKEFLRDYNLRSTTSYGVVVDVFEIITDLSENHAVDWEVAFETAGTGKIGLGSPSVIPDSSLGGLSANILPGNWNIEAALQMVHKNASIYSHIRKSGKTKNAVPTIVSSLEDRGIVSGRSVTVSSEGFSQESIETKLIDEGFSITTTPRITSMGRIDLDVVVNTKVIKGVEKVGTSEQEIQVEETRRQNNRANVIIRDGDTTVISAYERNLTAADIASLSKQYPWWVGGSNGARRYKSNLIVVVRPTILER
ncbi:putative Lipoprotein [Vibrio nigripulchritudo SOn1]|uniref:Lipoprotein n=1 Tax=Vibrio nigripulchritudo SOn1 TaxID=1238450 RepID=A0AAV2VQW1_9VIBR|nr:lipoprotein [Vibrio nigripulchritudo]CCO46814.1 putative Lipoprotein [Vibrio nigripulchritudo SOn1]